MNDFKTRENRNRSTYGHKLVERAFCNKPMHGQ